MLAHYDFVSKDTLSYFTARPAQAKRDSDFALRYAVTNAHTPEQQRQVINALKFKCEVLWVQLDGLWGAYVEGYRPPDAWTPQAAQAAA